MPGDVPPSGFGSATDCQYWLPGWSCTCSRSSGVITPPPRRGLSRSGGAIVTGGWPGSRKTATSVLPETLEIVPIAEAISSWSDARSAASDESRMSCAAAVALFDASSTASRCAWNRFDATLKEMYRPITRIARPERPSVMMTVRNCSERRHSAESRRGTSRHEPAARRGEVSAADIPAYVVAPAR